jgi:selenocysteine-specific translation elongation factor
MADALLQTSIQLLREENAKQSDQVIKNTATTSEGVDDLKKTMKDLLGEFRGQAGVSPG